MTPAAAAIIARIERDLALLRDELAELAAPGATGGNRQLASDPVADLREACREREVRVSADDCVAEADAAELIGHAASTLRHWRAEGRPLPFRRRPNGRVVYRLTDLAQHLAGDPEN